MNGPLPKVPQECEDDAYWDDHDESDDTEAWEKRQDALRDEWIDGLPDDDGPEPDDVTWDDDGDCYGY